MCEPSTYNSFEAIGYKIPGYQGSIELTTDFCNFECNRFKHYVASYMTPNGICLCGKPESKNVCKKESFTFLPNNDPRVYVEPIRMVLVDFNITTNLTTNTVFNYTTTSKYHSYWMENEV